MKRVSGMCRTITKYLTFVSSGSRKKKTKKAGLKKALNDIMNENIPNLARDINLQIQETEQIPISINPKRLLPRQNLS